MFINFTVAGEGRDMVLLHGWGCNANLMKPSAELLSQSYRVWTLDLFGFGKSDEAEITCFEDYIDALHVFIKTNDIKDPILLGHSFGGRVALFYALKYPVTALVLTASAGLQNRLSLGKRFRVFLHKKKILKNKGSIDYQNANEYLKKLLVMSVNADIYDHLKEITIPVCLIWGEKDQQTPLWMGKLMEKQLPNAQLFIFKNEDHFAYYHETERFVYLVLAYLLGVDV